MKFSNSNVTRDIVRTYRCHCTALATTTLRNDLNRTRFAVNDDGIASCVCGSRHITRRAPRTTAAARARVGIARVPADVMGKRPPRGDASGQ